MAAADEPSAPPSSPLTADEKAFFAWWDTLEFPDVTTLAFVKLWTPYQFHLARVGDETEWPEGAFLLAEDGPRFVVFHTDLTIEHLRVAAPDPSRDRDPGTRFERADLGQYVREGLARLEKVGPEVPWFSKPDPFDAHRWSIPNQAFRIAVLARACAGRGLEELAHRLIDRARHEQTRPPLPQQYGHDDPRPRAPLSSVKGGIEREAYDALVRSYSDASLTWADLLREEERLARGFEPERLTAAGGRVAMLKAIVEEKRQAREHPPRLIEELAQEEKIERLIDDLRDVGAYDRDWRHRVEEKERPPDAAERLAEIGFPAVPALLDALEDERPTRSVHTETSHKGQFRNSALPMCVGDLAWRILTRLSCWTLGEPYFGGLGNHGLPPRRQVAERWYARVKERGEKAVLVEEVRKGGVVARSAAIRLAVIDAAAAVDALVVGIRATGEERAARHNLVNVLTRVESLEATEALLRLLPSLHGSATGVMVASSLYRRGRKEGLKDLIRAWKEERQAAATSGSHELLARIMRFNYGDLIWALARTSELAAVSALADGLASRSINDRIAVIRAFSPSRVSSRARKGLAPAPDDATDAAIEALLAGRLEDTERRRGRSMGGTRAGTDPVVGEFAAWVLAERYPERYSFDPNAAPRDRDVQRIAAANQWRAANGVRPLGPPTKRPAPTPTTIDALRDDFDDAATGAEAGARAAAIAALEAKGLAAVPALREALTSLADDAPGRSDLEALVGRLAFVVTEVQIAGEESLAGDDFQEALAAAKGKPITGAMWWGLYQRFATSAPGGAITRLALSVERDGAERGLLLRAVLTPAKAGIGTQDVGDTSYEHPRFRRDDDIKRGASGGMQISVFTRPGMFATYEATFDELLAATGPDVVVTIEGQITVHR